MNLPVKVVFASGNAGKAREVRALFSDVFGDSVELVLQGDLGVTEAEETGDTFVDNALLKARHAARATGLPALADDSGIEVDALDGRPGVYSARYAGAAATDSDNINKLLAELEAVPAPQRTARFRCVLAYVNDAHDRDPLLADGAWEGSIASEPSGSKRKVSMLGSIYSLPLLVMMLFITHETSLPRINSVSRGI